MVCEDARVGFDLECVFTLDSAVLALYERVIPGGSGHALRTGGQGWPDGWVLPAPWELEHGVGGTLRMDPAVLEPANPRDWKAAAGVPDEPDPLEAFEELDLRLGSFPSLAPGVISDHTSGGVLAWEYAALWANGELLAAAGVDPDADSAFELDAGDYRPAKPASTTPTDTCAVLLDERFRWRSLFDGYLPREAHREGPACRDVWSGPMPWVHPDWRARFPALAESRPHQEHEK